MGWVAKAALGAAALYVGAWAYRSASMDLTNLSSTDFGSWWPLMAPALVSKVDRFVGRVAEEGGTAYISPASGSLGRHQGPGSESQHNVDRWGLVRAADVMVEGISLHRAYQLARQLGFTGIGVYPDWSPAKGVHLDVRDDASPNDPATWAGVDAPQGGQKYVGLNRVLPV